MVSALVMDAAGKRVGEYLLLIPFYHVLNLPQQHMNRLKWKKVTE